MLRNFNSKIKNRLFFPKSGLRVEPELEENPLAGYLKVFENQHNMIHVLYRGLIISFAIFLFLIGYLIYNATEEALLPEWVRYALYGTAFLLLFGFVKAVMELKKYKVKNENLLQQVQEHLSKDLLKIEKIKLEHSFLHKTHRQIHKKIESLTDEEGFGKAEHKGWDSKSCPNCESLIELTAEFCPRCKHYIGSMMEN